MSILQSAVIEPDSNPVAAAPRALASVLVIDDEEIVCNTLSALLKAEGFDAVTAFSGEEGAELLRGRQFEVVITDLVMSGMDGIQTIAALKEVDPDVEVIILTGYATVNSTIAALRQGACDFLLKPIGMAQLGPALMRALEKRRPKAALPVYEASRPVLATLNRQDLIPAILTLAQRTMRASAVGLALVPPEGTGLRVALSDDHGPFTEAVAESIAQIALQAGEALRDPSFQAGQSQSSDAGIPAGSVLTYPLEMRNALLGALVLWRDQGRAQFSAFDGERGKLLADEIVIALDNARLYRELSHKVEELETAKREVARAEACARAVMETAQEAIVLLDKEGVVWDFNPKAVEMLGATREQAVGRDFADFALPPRLLDGFRKHLETAYREGKDPLNGCLEVRALRQNGEEFPLEISTAVIETPQGKLLSTFARDITDRKKAEEALSESEDRYRDLVENSFVLIGTHDAKGRFLSLNHAAARLLEATNAKEMAGRSLTDYVPPDLLPQFAEYLKTVLQEGHAEGLMVLATPSGKVKIVEYHNTLRRQDSNEPIVRWVGQDVTYRIQAEKAQAFLASLVESSQDAIIGVSLEGIIVSWNRGAQGLYGYRAEEVVGQSISILTPPDHFEELGHLMENAGRGDGISGCETVRVRKDGRRLDVSLTVSPVQDAAGKITSTASIGRDITERKRAENQTRLQTAALESAANGITIVNREGRIIWVNRAFTRLTGYPASEVIGQNPRVLKSGAHDAAFYQKLWNTVLSGEVWQGEIFNRRKDGTLYTEEMTITPVRDGSGVITHFIAIKQDITERKRAEASMAERHRLATLVAEVGVAVTGAETLRQGLQQCAEILVRDIDAAFARVWTVNEEDKVLELQASAGMYTHIDGGHARVPIGKFKIGRIAEGGEPHLTNSVQEDSWVGDPEWARREGMVAFAGYPLKVEERVLGVVAAFARKPMTEATLQAFAAVADNIAQFIKRKRAEEALRESEERYRLLFERNLAGVYRGTLLSRRLLDCNDAYARILGYDSRQDVLNEGKLHAFYDPAEYEIAKTRLLNEKVLTNLEVRFCHKDQAPVWVLENVSLIEARKGEEPLVEGTLFDITKRKQAEQALAHERDLLRALMDNVSDFIYFKDGQSRFVRINEAHAKALGISDPAQAVGKTDFDFFPLEDAKNYYGDEKEVLQTGQPLTCRVESVRQADGQRRWCSATKVPIRDDQGRITGLVGITRDITEYKRAEEALRDSEEKYRVLYESSRDAIMMLAPPEWEFTAGNPAAIALFGARDEGEFLAAAPWTLSPEYQPDGELSSVKSPQMIDAAMKTGSNFFEWTHKKFSGEEFFATVTLTRMIYRGQTILQATVRDITEHKRAQDELQQSRQMLQTILDTIPQRVFWKDRNLIYLGCNRALALDAGVQDPPKIIGKTDFDLSWGKTAELYRADDTLVMEQESAKLNYQEILSRPDGSLMWLRTSKLPLRDHEGRVIGVIGTYEDVTERKRAEEELLFKTALLEAQSETTIDGILVVDPTGQILLANRQFARMLDVPEEAIRTKEDKKLLERALTQLKDPDAFLERIKYLYAHETEKTRDEIEFKDGRVFDRYSSPLQDSTGKLHGRIWYFRDITERKQAEEEVRESNELVSLLLDSIPEAVYGIDMQGNCTFCNPSCLQLIGYREAADLQGKNMHDLIHHTRQDGTPYPVEECHIYEAFRRGHGTHIDDEVLWRRDGSNFPAEYWSRPLHRYGNVIGTVVTFVDITERKRVEEELRLTQFSMEHAAESIFWMDPQGRIVYVNAAACRTLERSREELLSLSIPDIDPNLSPRDWGGLWEKGKALGSLTLETCHQTKGGRVFPVEVTSNYIEFRGKEYTCAFARDITERKRAEEELVRYAEDLESAKAVQQEHASELARLVEELAQERDLLGTLMDTLPDYIYYKDHQSRYLRTNPAHAKALGLSDPRQAVGKTDFEFFPEDDARGYFSDEQQVIETGQPLIGRIERVRHPDGQYRWYSTSKVPIRDIQGRITGLVGITRDITEHRRAEEALRDSEEKHRVLYESSRDAIMMTAPPEWKLAAGNPAAIALFGARDEQELVAAAPWTLSPEYQPDGELSSVKARQRIDAAMERGSNFFEWTYKKFSGEEFLATVALTRMIYRGQTLLQSTVRDITERKAVEEKLQESETKYRSLVSNIPDVIWTIDSELQFAFISPNIERLSGFSLEEVYRCGAALFFESIHTEDVGSVGNALEALFARGEPYDVQCRVRRKDGEWIWVRNRAVTTYEKNGVRYADGLLSDITPSKRAEEALRASEERYRELFENASDIIYTTDLDTRLRSLNRAGQQTLGYSAEEATQLTLSQVVAPKHWEIVKQSRERLWAGDSNLTFEVEATTKAGRPIMLEVTPRLIYKDGKPVGVQGIARNVTGRDVAEMELRHTQKLESVGRLASGIAHEINTPIQFVGDNTRFLQESFESFQSLLSKYQELRSAFASGTASPEILAEVQRLEEESDCAFLMAEVPQAINQTLEGVERVATIVRAMKEFAHPESRQMAATDLNRALQSTLTVARNELKYVADVETVFGELPLVVCNVGDLNQVFLNLLVNAAHAIGDVVKGTFAKGKIGVRTQAEGNTVLVTISDTGCGIPEANRSKVFDPFFTTKEVGRGTGQGLAISRSVVVDRHKGTLSFDSEVGKGTTFYIRLPVDPGEGSQEMKAP